MAYRIEEARTKKGWTQADLAKAVGSSQQVISRYEAGLNEPKAEILKRMSKALGVTISYLLGVDDDPRIVRACQAPSGELRYAPLLGRIAAGDPREAIAQAGESVPLPPEFSNDDNEYFWLQPSGGSMNKHFTSDAWLLIKYTGEVQNGEIGAVMVNGDDATVKRVLYKDDGVHLVPESYDPEYREIFISKDDPAAPSFRPLGPVVYFRAKDGWRG